MDDSQLTTGFKVYAPEATKLIVLTSDAVNPLRPAAKKTVALRVVEDITWTREAHARITYSHGGRVLKQEGTFCDYYGFLSSVQDLFEDFEARKKLYGVSKESSLEITIRMALVDHPTLGFAKEGWGGRKLYTPVGGAIYLAEGVADDEDFLSKPWEEKTVLRQVSHSVCDVWSSKRSDEENHTIFDNYCLAAAVDQRIVGKIGELEDHEAA
ncbi:hypothetical protein G6L37_02185 [Agrobacterium rubi]|nr:hypothetical protein [Agrobacterium rubi]NTF24203.1 hypothetical protein [Agrobacterium rubi]